MSTALDPRAAELLKLLVERYIRDGQPVGSRTLSRMARLGLSAATIRNVMADLDELGLVASPHTSAGRVPTTRGYRYFVDSLLSPERLAEEDLARIAQTLVPERHQSQAELVHSASTLLSQLTHMAGVVTVPRRNFSLLRRIEFLPLSGNRVLAILVVNHYEVQNRIIHTDRPYGADELERYAAMINDQYAGRDLVDLRRALMDDTVATQGQLNLLLRQAAEMADQSNPAQPGDFVLAGGTNLMGFQELADVQRLRSLFEALDRKRDLLNLFDQCLQADGVQLFIGDESGYKVLDECTVVTAPYYVDGQVAGVLGVIGPTRMAYHRIIPLVTETARVLSRGLKSSE